jgi:hypothetical protein
MKITTILSWSLLSIFPIITLAQAPNTLTESETKDGWKLLFDGHSLSGFRGYKSETVGTGWEVKDGAITLTHPKAGDLLTVGEFRDFELSLEWKISEGGNSGIIYRAGLGEAAPYKTGPEYQILDNEKATDNKQANHLAGALYDIGADIPANASKPAGEWNTTRILVRGWQIEHWLNGQRVDSLDLSTTEGKAALAKSKFKTWEKFASLATGHIALQDHGNEVAFRSIKVREF